MNKYMFFIVNIFLCLTCNSTKNTSNNQVDTIKVNNIIIPAGKNSTECKEVSMPYSIDSVSVGYKNYKILVVTVSNEIIDVINQDTMKRVDIIGQDIYIFQDKQFISKIEFPFTAYIQNEDCRCLNYFLTDVKIDTTENQEVILCYGTSNLCFAMQEFLAACDFNGTVLAYWVSNPNGIVLRKNIDFFKKQPNEAIYLDNFTKVIR